jgi:autoinducer 2-degrading protein
MSYVVAVEFRLKDGAAGAFMPVIRAQAKNSLEREPGCLHFDVCTDPDDPGRVFLYEIYTDRAAFDAHRGTDHYAGFTEASTPLIADKRVDFWERDTP